MKYIRTKDGRIFDYELTHNIDVDGFAVLHNLTGWNNSLTKEDIVKIADTIEDLIQSEDIIFYYDFHSQKEQCMCLNDILGIKDINITKLLIPVEDDYRCVAKAEHEYHQFGSMKQVVKKGELKLL